MTNVYPEFLAEIKTMNDAWGIESNDAPVDLGHQRFHNFRYIFSKELAELDDIPSVLTSLEARVARADWLCDLYIYLASEFRRWGQDFSVWTGAGSKTPPVFTAAGWEDLNFFQTNCIRIIDEQTAVLFDKGDNKFHKKDLRPLTAIIPMIENLADLAQIPFSDCLKAVMESNRTKLGDDGKPIVNIQGKVEKGPNYVPPEPALTAILQAAEAP